MSDLLNKASLVMVPSGYKEDTVYSVVPTDGSGDLSFTRASNGTRVNSAGLVEVCPWNLLNDSNTFTAGWAIGIGGGSLGSLVTDPFGGTTAQVLNLNNNGILYNSSVSPYPTTISTTSIWMRTQSGSVSIQLGNPVGSPYYTKTITTTWTRFDVQVDPSAFNGGIALYNSVHGSAITIEIFGAQVNIGSTAKPYFPTTDRLNVPRLTYQNGGGGCPSLLLEKQSTNVLTQSNVLTGVSGTTATVNDGISPDGTQNAILISGTSGYAYAGTSNNFGGGVTLTFSAFLKYKQGIGQASIGIGGAFSAYLYIDGLDDGNIVLTNYAGSGVSGVTTGYEVHANGWYRFWLTATYTGSPGYEEWQIATQGTNTQFWYYGGQNEASSYMTSYIPTSGSSATRVADACYKTGISSLIGQTQGTLFVDFNYIATTNTNDTTPIRLLGSGSAQIYLEINANNTFEVVVVNSAGSLVFNSTSTAQTAGRHKFAIAYKADDYAYYLNGTQIAVDTNGAFASASLDSLNLGMYQSGSQLLDGSINQAVLFPTRLTNAELASLTTI